jgi:hypothetical protein
MGPFRKAEEEERRKEISIETNVYVKNTDISNFSTTELPRFST